MSAVQETADLDGVLAGAAAMEDGGPPQVFVRAITTPPGLPWEQHRAAQLEARHGSPLPIADLVHRLRRIGGWSIGRPGRFAVFYVRSREFRAPFETTMEVEGQAVRVAFGSGTEQLRRARKLGLGLGLGAATIALLAAGVMLALDRRAGAEARLAALEQTVAARLRAAETLEARRDLVRRLSVTAPDSRSVEAVLEDLSWAASARAPDARILAVHWEPGLLAFEVRGEGAPFSNSDRPVESVSEPVRPGVFLWGVSREPDRRSERVVQPVSDPGGAP